MIVWDNFKYKCLTLLIIVIVVLFVLLILYAVPVSLHFTGWTEK